MTMIWRKDCYDLIKKLKIIKMIIHNSRGQKREVEELSPDSLFKGTLYSLEGGVLDSVHAVPIGMESKNSNFVFTSIMEDP